MHIDSKQLNRDIREVEDRYARLYSSFGGKLIPYGGWFWRDIDFNARPLPLGILPPMDGFEINDRCRVAFLARNQWQYETLVPTDAQCDAILRLLLEAVGNPTAGNFAALDGFMQSLLSSSECRRERWQPDEGLAAAGA